MAAHINPNGPYQVRMPILVHKPGEFALNKECYRNPFTGKVVKNITADPNTQLITSCCGKVIEKATLSTYQNTQCTHCHKKLELRNDTHNLKKHPQQFGANLGKKHVAPINIITITTENGEVHHVPVDPHTQIEIESYEDPIWMTTYKMPPIDLDYDQPLSEQEKADEDVSKDARIYFAHKGATGCMQECAHIIVIKDLKDKNGNLLESAFKGDKCPFAGCLNPLNQTQIAAFNPQQAPIQPPAQPAHQQNHPPVNNWNNPPLFANFNPPPAPNLHNPPQARNLISNKAAVIALLVSAVASIALFSIAGIFSSNLILGAGFLASVVLLSSLSVVVANMFKNVPLIFNLAMVIMGLSSALSSLLTEAYPVFALASPYLATAITVGTIAFPIIYTTANHYLV